MRFQLRFNCSCILDTQHQSISVIELPAHFVCSQQRALQGAYKTPLILLLCTRFCYHSRCWTLVAVSRTLLVLAAAVQQHHTAAAAAVAVIVVTVMSITTSTKATVAAVAVVLAAASNMHMQVVLTMHKATLAAATTAQPR
jgi:hypothetical protein